MKLNAEDKIDSCFDAPLYISEKYINIKERENTSNEIKSMREETKTA